MIRLLDSLMSLCGLLLVSVLLTGGSWDRAGLTRPDGFAVATLIVGLVRFKMTGSFFPESWVRVSKLVSEKIESSPKIFLASAFILYLVVYTTILSLRYLSFRTNAFDFGFIDQSLWSTSHGVGILHSDLSRGGINLGEHFAPILLLLTPGYWLFDQPYWQFFTQTFIIGSGFFFIYAMARSSEVSKAQSFFLATLYLLYLPVRGGNTFDLREDAFFIPIFFSMLFALKRGKYVYFWVFALLSFFVKENAPLVIFMVSIWLFFRGQRKQAVAGALLSITAFYIVNHLLMPVFAGGAANTTLVLHFSRFGSTNAEIIHFIVSHPFTFAWDVLRQLTDRPGLSYLFRVFIPLFPFMFFVAPSDLRTKLGSDSWVWVIALALAAMNMVGVAAVRSLGSHYELILIPFLFFGAVEGLKKLHPRVRGYREGFALLLCFVVFGRSPIYLIRDFQPTPKNQCLNQLLSQVDSKWSVTTSYGLYPHLSRRAVARHIEAAPSSQSEDLVIASNAEGISQFDEETLPNRLLQKLSLKDPQWGGFIYQPLVNKADLNVWCLVSKCGDAAKIFEANQSCLN